MDNQPQPTKPTNKALWIVLAIVILAIAGYGIYTYVSDKDNENTNNANANKTVNTNISSNTNTVTNGNANAASNANTNINATNWKTYENSTYGYALKYPNDWKVIASTGMVTELSPSDGEYSVEGGVAYPVSITGYTGASSDYLKNIASDKKQTVTVNGQSAIKITGYLDSVSYLFANQIGTRYVVIGTNYFLLHNISTSERSSIEQVFEAILQTFTFA